jgi:hypothetical protein
MSALTEAMRKRFKTPKEAIRALGLDESLLALDSAEAVKMPTQFASTAALLVGTAIKPLLRPKAKIDLMPVFKDLTADGFDAKEFQGALDEALKGKLVKGADIKLAFDNFMPHVEGMAKGVDESVSEPQHNAMEAAAHGNSTLGIPQPVGKEYAEADKGKPMPPAKDNLFMKKAMDWMKSKGMDTAEFESAMGGGMDSEEEEAEEVTEGFKDVKQEAEDRRARDARMGRDKRADDRRADDRRADDRRADDGDAHHAMDEASIEKRVTEKLKSKFDAARDVKPWVGEVDPMAFDSGEAIYRHALKARGHKRWNTAHAEALRDLLDTYPKQGMRPVERSADPKYAMDESRRADAVKLAPGLANIRIGV